MDLLPFIDSPPINIVSVSGMGFISGIGLSSLAFIMLAATFRAMDPALEESAQIHGLTFFQRIAHVTMPLMWPGILAAGIYIGTIGLASFDVPAIIGMANRIFTFSTFIFNEADPQEGPPNFSIVGAASVLMIVVGLLLSWWYLKVIGRSHRYTVVTGKSYRPNIIPLGRWWIAGWAFIGLKLALGVVFPFLALVWASLMPYFQPFSMEALATVSLENFRQIPWDIFWTATKNTAILTLTVPTILLFVGLAISWVVIRSGFRYAWLVDMVAFLPHAVPNLIFSVAILVIALFWIPEYIPFYNTIYILLVVFVVARISFPTRVYNNALLQIHKELDEAAYVSGLGPFGVLRSILAPLLAPATLYAWIWIALLSYRELTLAAFLTAKDNQTLPTLVLGFVARGEATGGGGDLAAAPGLHDSAGSAVLLLRPPHASVRQRVKLASFDFATLALRYAQDETGKGPTTVRPEPFDKLRTGASGAKSKDAIPIDQPFPTYAAPTTFFRPAGVFLGQRERVPGVQDDTLGQHLAHVPVGASRRYPQHITGFQHELPLGRTRGPPSRKLKRHLVLIETPVVDPLGVRSNGHLDHDVLVLDEFEMLSPRRPPPPPDRAPPRASAAHTPPQWCGHP